MIDVLLLHSADFLFEGPMMEAQLGDLLYGWTSDLSMRVFNFTEESMLRGDAILYDPTVTPILTAHGGLAASTITTYTGQVNGTGQAG